jgi:serine protease AprX
MAGLIALLIVPLAPAAPASTPRSHNVRVIVRGSSAVVRAAIRATGGKVTKRLPIIHGIAATVPANQIATLRSVPGIVQVSRDAHIGFNQTAPSATATPVNEVTSSAKLWKEGVTGKDVTVALLDTGIYAHPDLAGRVLGCVDMSGESGGPADCKDTFGHGTFMAGLIAGNGASSGGKYSGAAPEAKLFSVKVAGYDGASDVSNVLAGIQWVVSHKTQYNIRVLNLSLGTDSSQSYKLSPLNYAVEKAWKAGIVVVVSAGNSGPEARTVLKPADDPYVITVGASNDEGTVDISDDQIPVFSSRGPTKADGLTKPDLVAPGVHTVSLRSPGSAIDTQFGATAVLDGQYFKGTGTSMSAALISGVVAQMLQANPLLSPNQVKYRLMQTARTLGTTDPNAAGEGIVDAYAAARTTITGQANQGLASSTGLGPLQNDRGSLAIDVQSLNGQVTLTGEYVAQVAGGLVGGLLGSVLGLVKWSGSKYTTTGWDPVSWLLSLFAKNDWAGASWKGASWKSTIWDGASWKGASWKNLNWDGASWKYAEWDGASWKGASWKATSWQTAWYAAAWD